MTNIFLKVNKDLFSIGLNPTEILIAAQILEYQTKELDCFISDESFAKDFGVSQSTISRAIKSLESQGILVRKTKNTQKGKLRYLQIVIETIEELRKRQNDSCENDKEVRNSQIDSCENDKEVRNSQIDSCGNVNLTFSNKQNDFIKENIKDKDKIKENQFVPRGKVEATSEVMKTSTKPNGEFNF